jgi:hypothetical protein
LFTTVYKRFAEGGQGIDGEFGMEWIDGIGLEVGWIGGLLMRMTLLLLLAVVCLQV